MSQPAESPSSPEPRGGGRRKAGPSRPLRAPRPERRATRDSDTPVTAGPLERLARGPVPRMITVVALVAGVCAIVAVLMDWGPGWLDGAGAVAIGSAYTWLLAERTSGRPNVSAGLATLLGAGVLWLNNPVVSAGAAALTAVVAGVVAVMLTRPARSVWQAFVEAVLATLTACTGALATLGWSPAADPTRFRYVVLALGMALALMMVYRLGAGLHGLGRRGIFGVTLALLALAAVIAYTEVLRRFAVPTLLVPIQELSRWWESHLLVTPRPRVAFIGVPALVWGTHMRARRRQGWWMTAFGAVGTLSVSCVLVDPVFSFLESGLRIGYGVVIGLLIGWLVIRLDLALTGSRGRRARAAEEAAAERAEPGRFAPL